MLPVIQCYISLSGKQGIYYNYTKKLVSKRKEYITFLFTRISDLASLCLAHTCAVPISYGFTSDFALLFAAREAWHNTEWAVLSWFVLSPFVEKI